jgi:hypothetical protein
MGDGDMTMADIYDDKTPVRDRSTELLRAQLALFVQAKFWRGPYFEIERELHNRATWQWVREDVFGHTFTGS